MNAHDAAMIGWLLFAAGGAIGFVCAFGLRDKLRAIERKQHERTVMDQGKEIARLRAQVALHIGKEK